jgi:hypothetical protein
MEEMVEVRVVEWQALEFELALGVALEQLVLLEDKLVLEDKLELVLVGKVQQLVQLLCLQHIRHL